MQRCFFIAICALFTACNPYERDIKHWEQLVEQAERIELSAPSAAHLLLDSVEYPVLMSKEWLADYSVSADYLADVSASDGYGTADWYTYNDDSDLDFFLYFLLIIVAILFIFFIICIVYLVNYEQKEFIKSKQERIKVLQDELTYYECVLKLCDEARELYQIKGGQLQLERQQIEEDKAQLDIQLKQKNKEYRRLKNALSKQLTEDIEDKLRFEEVSLQKELLEKMIHIKNMRFKQSSLKKENYELRRNMISEVEEVTRSGLMNYQIEINHINYLMLTKSRLYNKIKKQIKKHDMLETLTEREWTKIRRLLGLLYPTLPDLLDSHGFTPTEQLVCYLSFFELTEANEAALLGISLEEVKKTHTNIYKKLRGYKSKGNLLYYFLRMI